MALDKSWAGTLQDLETWLQTDLVRAMVHGGLGIQGIAQTPFYKFVTSSDGLSQLGIERTEPPKLLAAYERTIKTGRNNRQVFIRFGDVALLKLATPHPASGTGHLTLDSWLEWVVDKKKVARGFVPRSALPAGSQKRIRLNSAPGGLMLASGKFGSSGLWRFPARFQDFEDKWLRGNVRKIERAVIKQTIVFLTKRVK